MSHQGFTQQQRTLGRLAAWAVFLLGVVYAVTTVLGLLSLKSPLDPIGDPYFSIMELLIVLLAPCMLVSMVAVHGYASHENKVYSLTALIFMSLMTGLTVSIHFVILTVNRQAEFQGVVWLPLLLSFKWPSLVYILDILTWDIFFALSILFAAPVFKGNRLETTVRVLMIVSGVLSLAGLAGVPLADMQVRNIGVLGYAGFGPVVFLLLGFVFGRATLARMTA